MYASHCPSIARYSREHLDGFKRCLFFVICSIRQQISLVPDQLEEVAQHSTSAPCLFGHKIDAIEFIERNARELWRDVCRIPLNEPALAIERLCDIPGLGIVKAAFVCQLLGFDVACLDSRNVKREGRNPRAYRSDGPAKKQGPAFKAKIARYVAETQGRAREYWDAWCRDVADARGMTAEEVSALHLAIIKREYDLEETF